MECRPTTRAIITPPPSSRIRRFASIDFLRGLVIVVMLVLHIVSDTLDLDYYLDHDNENNLADGAVVNVLVLITFPFWGGCLAGLFLLTSAIGNGASTRRNYTNQGHTPMSIMRHQVLRGAILICAAMFSAAFLGYHGAWGSVMTNLHRLPDIWSGELDITSWRYNGYVFETLHTIGWCTLLNGCIQGVLLAVCGRD
jgi:hypothetical protein